MIELNNNNKTAIQFTKPCITSPGSPMNKFRNLEQNLKKICTTSPEKSAPSSPVVVTRSLRAQYNDAKCSPPKNLDFSSNEPVVTSPELPNGGTSGSSTVSSPRLNGAHIVHKHSLGAVHSLAEKFQNQNNHCQKLSNEQNHQQSPDDEETRNGSFAAALR